MLRHFVQYRSHDMAFDLAQIHQAGFVGSGQVSSLLPEQDDARDLFGHDCDFGICSTMGFGSRQRRATGQAADLRPRQNQKTGVVGQIGKPRRSLDEIPAQKLVPGAHLPSRRPKEQAAEITSPAVADQILEVLPIMRR